jgi:hypothetical protein
MMMRAYALLVCLALAGCGDVNYPTVDKVEVVQGDFVLSSVVPRAASETAIQEDVPVDAIFRIHFSETMDMASAEGQIVIRENRVGGEVVAATLTARLNAVTATPTRAFIPETNHVLDIAAGIDDVSGNGTLRSYKISFFTAP